MREVNYPNAVNVLLSDAQFKQLHAIKNLTDVHVSWLVRIAIGEMLDRLASDLAEQASVSADRQEGGFPPAGWLWSGLRKVSTTTP